MLEKIESFETDEATQEVITTLLSFSDFKDMGKGLYLPHVMEMNSQGQVITFVVQSIIVSKKIKSKTFSGDFVKYTK